MPNAYSTSGFAMAIWRVFKWNSITNLFTVFPKKFLKNASYIFLTIFKLKKTILHQVGHVFNIFESSLSHKDRESISRPKIVSIAESFIRVNLKDLSEFPLRTKEWLSFFMEFCSSNVISYLCYFIIYYKPNLFIDFTQLQ